MLSFQKRIFQTETGSATPEPKEFALRSSSSTGSPGTTNACAFSLNIGCGIDTQVLETITEGDRVFNGPSFIVPFAGGNNYYSIQIQSGAMTVYVCQIDNSGFISTIYGTCS
jgi:hypothetical protein